MSEDRERHDRLFRHTFSNLDNAEVELRALLPSSVTALVDWSTLKVESGALRGQGKRLECDMLYSAELAGKQAYFYVLFEHQSTVDELMAYRMVNYVLGILERLRQETGRASPLPVVIPAVVHHSETGWTAAVKLHDLFDSEVMAIEGVSELVPQMKFLLDDVSGLANEELLSRASTPRERIVSLALWALRDGRNESRMRANFEQWLQTIGEIWQEERAAVLLEEVFWYICLAEQGLSHQDLTEAAEKAALPAREALMTLAEQLRQEGRQEGRLEAQVVVLLKQLTLKFGELSEEERARVSQASVESLELWSERVLTANTLEDVFA